MRMADETGRGQASGELAGKGERADVRAPDISDYSDLGIDRRRVTEWQYAMPANPS